MRRMVPENDQLSSFSLFLHGGKNYLNSQSARQLLSGAHGWLKVLIFCKVAVALETLDLA